VTQQCQESYSHVLVDLPHGLEPLTIAVLDTADRVLVVCDMTVPSVQNTKRAVDTLAEVEINKSKFKLVVNRYYEGADISLQRISEHLQMPIYWTIPYDSTVAVTAVNSGLAFEDADAHSELARSMVALAADLAGMEVKERPRKRFALFGR